MKSGGSRRVVAIGTAAVVAVALGIGATRWLGGGSASSSSSPGGSALATALARTTPASAPFAGLTEVRVRVGADRCLRVAVADTLDERVAGLRGKTHLGPYAGMLFVFGEPTRADFTMAGVTDPLDIAFFRSDGARDSSRAMRPCPGSVAECPVYRPDGAFVYALETPRGKLPAGAIGSCGS